MNLVNQVWSLMFGIPSTFKPTGTLQKWNVSVYESIFLLVDEPALFFHQVPGY